MKGLGSKNLTPPFFPSRLTFLRAVHARERGRREEERRRQRQPRRVHQLGEEVHVAVDGLVLGLRVRGDTLLPGHRQVLEVGQVVES